MPIGSDNQPIKFDNHCTYMTIHAHVEMYNFNNQC